MNCSDEVTDEVTDGFEPKGGSIEPIAGGLNAGLIAKGTNSCAELVTRIEVRCTQPVYEGPLHFTDPQYARKCST